MYYDAPQGAAVSDIRPDPRYCLSHLSRPPQRNCGGTGSCTRKHRCQYRQTRRYPLLVLSFSVSCAILTKNSSSCALHPRADARQARKRIESGCKGSNIIRTGKIFPEKNAPTYESFPISLQKHRQKLIHIIYNICARGGTRKTCERAHACRDVFTAAFPVGERGTGTATRLSSRRESDWKDAGWQRL